SAGPGKTGALPARPLESHAGQKNNRAGPIALLETFRELRWAFLRRKASILGRHGSPLRFRQQLVCYRLQPGTRDPRPLITYPRRAVFPGSKYTKSKARRPRKGAGPCLKSLYHVLSVGSLLVGPAEFEFEWFAGHIFPGFFLVVLQSGRDLFHGFLAE